VEAWENSTPHVVAWENSTPHVEARENSTPHVEAWENSGVHINNGVVDVRGQAVCWNLGDAVVTVSRAGQVIVPLAVPGPAGWLERHGIDVAETVILYKRVSCEYKTQEGTTRETTWTPGATLEHYAWNPTDRECGEGKFHACPTPYFCDEFRDEPDDVYVAIEVAQEDLYSWDDHPQYPHKIAFRRGTVLYECDVNGKRQDSPAVLEQEDD
jgi:hypothetical protein